MPRAGLDQARVVQAAAELADEQGLQALTVARLAERLGIRAPSLYAHVGGLDDLRRRIASAGAIRLAETLQEAAAGRSGQDALRAIADAYRAFAKAHPGSYAALQRADDRADASAAGARVVGVLLAVLRGYGREGDAALHAVRAIRSALHGFVLLETGGGFGIPLDLDESFRCTVELLDRGLRG
ncbi:MAG TPA: WHG domain-containing protein [Solirubrobacteraceae bacterium]|jgi:AcrR family transcriptional regulator|nr:WHG domain-containing protein [Solirubrobacteraceae bacterium]